MRGVGIVNGWGVSNARKGTEVDDLIYCSDWLKTLVEGVAAGTTGGQGKINSERTRLKGLHATTGGTVGDISFFNTSPISGTSLFSLQVATTTKDYIDPYIPDDGVLFDAGAYVDLPAGTAVSLTVFYDG